MSVSRRLVAVVVADVAGYSRLMERDEAGTHERLRALHSDLIAPKIAEHGGRTVKTSGDGMLLEFASATSALRCAVEIQREMGVRNLYVAPDERIEFRIGINLGDIIVEGDDIIGDGVNVAARLETLAEPGGICVASAVWEQVHEDLGIEFIDSGEQHVKNISKPIRVFRVGLGKKSAANASTAASAKVTAVRRLGGRRIAIIGGAIAVLAIVGIGTWQWMQRQGLAGSATVAGPSPRSIMVLPFGASAADATLGPLADSLTGDVTRALANSVRDARVAASNIALLEKGKAIDWRTLGRDANVRYVVAGDVRGTGDDIAVNVRLTDTMTGKELGSERRTIARARAVEDHELLVARVTAATRLMFQNAEGRRNSLGASTRYE
jgi:class 3 adenylate cyclase/TolB-like protein